MHDDEHQETRFTEVWLDCPDTWWAGPAREVNSEQTWRSCCSVQRQHVSFYSMEPQLLFLIVCLLGKSHVSTVVSGIAKWYYLKGRCTLSINSIFMAVIVWLQTASHAADLRWSGARPMGLPQDNNALQALPGTVPSSSSDKAPENSTDNFQF